VTLRRLSTADLLAFQRYRSDPDVGRYQGWSVMTDEAAARFLDDMGTAAFCAPATWFQIGIADRDSGRLLGDIGVRLRIEARVVADIGFTLSKIEQGRGLATEAVRGAIALLARHRGVGRFEATTDTRNLPSIRLLERLGMRRERTVDAIFRGQRCREHHYAIEPMPAVLLDWRHQEPA
jgi:aminoglycoside 6'-N-acetyltransferase